MKARETDVFFFVFQVRGLIRQCVVKATLMLPYCCGSVTGQVSEGPLEDEGLTQEAEDGNDGNRPRVT